MRLGYRAAKQYCANPLDEISEFSYEPIVTVLLLLCVEPNYSFFRLRRISTGFIKDYSLPVFLICSLSDVLVRLIF